MRNAKTAICCALLQDQSEGLPPYVVEKLAFGRAA
jgi:hypothetical protein